MSWGVIEILSEQLSKVDIVATIPSDAVLGNLHVGK
jgi:hypothetical protein